MLTSSRIPAAPPSLERLAPRCIPPTQSQIPRGAEAGAPALRQIVQWTLAAALIRGHFAKARVRVPRRPLHCLPSPDAHLELYIHFSDCGQKWRQRSGYDWGTRTASACASPAGRQPCKCAASSARARASAAADETVQKQRCTPKLDFERKTSPSDRKRFATLSVSVRPCNDSSLRILRQEQHARRNASEREGWAQTFAAGRRPRWSRRKCKQKEEEDDRKQFERDQKLVPHL